ncbi:hypothetical protein PsYK624_091700 [Phanerochaete sordida]|uniref:Uncharacterized protein n=1 Tax=Phanerochaete sordida TaxID=48140 RepID=A0A9P3LEY5_9APHY|nr:hypothetical protein PsYK624_091700 [Phanerochaete sordida]
MPPQPESVAYVSLPALHYLAFSGALEPTGTLLKNLKTSKLAAVFVNVTNIPQHGMAFEDPAQEPPSLSSAAQLIASAVTSAWKRGPYSHACLSFGCSRSSWTLCVAAQAATERLAEQLAIPTIYAPRNEFHISLSPSLCLSILQDSLSTLDIRSLSFTWAEQASDCTAILAALCSDVKEISFGTMDLRFVNDVLSQDVPSLHNLRAIDIGRCNLCTRPDHVDFPAPTVGMLGVPCTCSHSVDDFIGWITQRRAVNRPIEEVRLSSTRLGKSTLETLRNLDVNVVDSQRHA